MFNQYNQIIKEFFDLSDKATCHYIATLEDAGQEQLLSALSSSLYDKIVTKVDEIDFGTIPMSRGDVTKVEGFDRTMECLNTIRQIVVEYKQNPEVVDIVLASVQNIKDRKALFIKGFSLNMELPMVIYNCIVLAFERSVSLMIATCLEFIKDPNNATINAALDKAAYIRTQDDLLFKQLSSFNSMCKDKSLDKIIELSMKNPVHEDVEFNPIDPIKPGMNDAPEYDDSYNDDNYDESPLTPGNTVDPFSGEPIDDEPNACDNCDDNNEDDDPDENVEPENIPTVVPGDRVTSYDRPFNEDIALGAAAVGTIIGLASIPFIAKGLAWAVTKILIPSLRMMIYTFYYSRMRFADYLEIQADLIEANAAELQYSSSSTLSDDKKANTIKKQMKVVDKLRKWSNRFNIDVKATNNIVEKEAKKDESEKKIIAKNSDGDESIW